jgi:glycosyltransferase involved in cell wall biosynthesis
MKILLITDSYPPEIRSASHLMQELAIELKNRGHVLFVATSYPKYNLAEEYKNKIFSEVSEENSIKVIRINTLPHHKVNFLIRGIAQLTMPYIFFNKIKKYIDEIDAVIVYSPPLPLSIAGKRVKDWYGATYYLNVQDIFPQNAIDLGSLRNKYLIKFFESMEKKAYENADVVSVHSDGNLEFIRKKYPSLKKDLKIVHNWIDVKEFESFTRTGKFRKEFNLEDKFIFLFAGVIGPSQGLDFVISLAKEIEEYKDICFLIVGDGMEKESLQNMVNELDLKNVVFKPFVSKEQYPLLVKDSDVGLVSLTDKNKTPVVPGKILGYMAAAVPVLAFINKESDGHNIINSANCGYSSIWGDLETAKKNVISLYKDKKNIRVLGENGYRFVKENFSKEKIIDEILKLIDRREM